jgi:hypothetical protein
MTDVRLLEHRFFMNSTNLFLSFKGKAIDFTKGICETDKEEKKDGV